MRALRLREQVASIWLSIIVALTVSAIPIILAVAIHVWKGTDYGNLTRDPVVVAEVPIWTGFISQIGILLWAAAATVCLFCSTVLTGTPESSRNRLFFLASGALTLLLGLDDAFLLHEEVFPRLGVSEHAVYATYVGAVMFYLVAFRSLIMDSEFLLLGIALLGFALSVLSDLIAGPFLFEDGVKLLGIVTWLMYFSRTAYFTCRRAMANSGSQIR
jgi:cellulose synthase/poly-beta-1,6-N-acetylglucosamine synthase-like glycosyltransferase